MYNKENIAKERIILYILMIILLPLLTILQGGFFSWSFLPFLVAIMISLLVKKQIKLPLKPICLLFGMLILYAISMSFTQCDKSIAILETVKFALLPLSMIIGVNIKKESLLQAIILSALFLGTIGLISICKIAQFADAVYIVSGIGRLQSTMQYANSAAVVLACGIFALRYFYSLQNTKKWLYFLTLSELYLTVSLIFTYSRITIMLYFVLTFIGWLTFNKKERTFSLCQMCAGVLIFAVMQYFIFAGMSFVSFLILLFIVPFIAEINLKLLDKKSNNFIIFGAFAFFLSLGFMMLILFGKFEVDTLTIRLVYFYDGLKALLSNLWFGISPMAWSYRQYEFQSLQYFAKYIHNGYLQIALDGGIFALVAFIAAVVYSLVANIRAWKKERDVYYLYLLQIIAIVLIHSFFDFDFAFGNILVILGLCLSQGFKNNQMMNRNAIVLICISLFIVANIYLFAAESLSIYAQNQYQNNNYSAAYNSYNNLLRIRPYETNALYMQGNCILKLDGNQHEAKAKFEAAYSQIPSNTSYLYSMLKISTLLDDYHAFTKYKDFMLRLAPMQSKTYMDCYNFLREFYAKKIIDEHEFIIQKEILLESVKTANENMNSLKHYMGNNNTIQFNLD